MTEFYAAVMRGDGFGNSGLDVAKIRRHTAAQLYELYVKPRLKKEEEAEETDPQSPEEAFLKVWGICLALGMEPKVAVGNAEHARQRWIEARRGVSPTQSGSG